MKRHGDQWIGKGKGETWTDKIVRGTEVKGATLTMLSVNQEKGQWQASCVVDV
ncbi:archease [Coxiella burnetii]|uniref:archease n=1 Tax=Coxiella burnetii TaxID=777 RepID=UPI0000DAEBFA|nr:archease [Coxiella burnetii]